MTYAPIQSSSVLCPMHVHFTFIQMETAMLHALSVQCFAFHLKEWETHCRGKGNVCVNTQERLCLQKMN